MSNVEILEYENQWACHFRDLNKAWLEKYFSIEPLDVEILNHPQLILDQGGHIFFARHGQEIVGTFALIKNDDNSFELSKMAVSEDHQGQKIGHEMLAFCLQRARSLGARKVVLYSNTLLKPAIHLYQKFGFVEVPMKHSQYKRSNIKMERELDGDVNLSEQK